MATYRAERATLPSTGRSIPLVVDSQTPRPMPEARDFVLYLVGTRRASRGARQQHRSEPRTGRNGFDGHRYKCSNLVPGRRIRLRR